MQAAGEPTAQELHWAHTLAYLFTEERGGDLTNPAIHHAAQAALNRGEGLLAGLRRAARLRSGTYKTILGHLNTVRNGFAWASRPGILRQAAQCTCGAFQGPAQPSEPPSPESAGIRQAIENVATWAAKWDPRAAEEWIRDALAQPGAVPDQVIYISAGMLASSLDGGKTWTTDPRADTPDGDGELIARTIDALIVAGGDQDRTRGQGAAEQTLGALRHPDPDRHHRRRHLVLLRILTSLGGFLLDRAHTIARAFHEDGGGYLADPTVRQAATAAVNTFDKFIFANMRVTGHLDEDTYLHFVGQMIVAGDDFDVASRYTAIPNS